MRTVVIIQARVGSTRLRGKIFKKLGSKTVLHHVTSWYHNNLDDLFWQLNSYSDDDEYQDLDMSELLVALARADNAAPEAPEALVGA